MKGGIPDKKKQKQLIKGRVCNFGETGKRKLDFESTQLKIVLKTYNSAIVTEQMTARRLTTESLACRVSRSHVTHNIIIINVKKGHYAQNC